MAATDRLNIKITLDNAASKGLDQAKFSINELSKATALASRSMRRFAQSAVSSTDGLALQIQNVAKNMRVLGKALNDVTKKAEITSDKINNFHTSLKNSSANVGKFSMSLGGLQGKLGTLAKTLFSFKGLIVGVGAGMLAKSFISAADAAENYKVRLRVVLRSQQEANLMFKEVGDYASTVSFEYKDLLEASTRLAGVMEGGAAEVKKYLPVISDLAAATGIGIQEATGQIIRMYSAGAASADLFRERGVLSMLGFQAGVKYTAAETRKQLIKAFEDPTSKFRDASKLLASTWGGLVSMMADRWFQFKNSVMDSGLFEYMKVALELVLQYVDKLKNEGNLDEWATNQGRTIIEVFAVIAQAAGWITDIFKGWVIIWQGVKVAMAVVGEGVIWLAKAFNQLFTYMYDGLELLVKGAAKVADKLRFALGDRPANDLKGLANGFRDMGDSLRDLDKRYDAHIDKLRAVVKQSVFNVGQLGDQLSYHERIKNALKEIDAIVAKRKFIREANAWGPFQPTSTGAGGGGDKKGKAPKQVTDLERLRAELAEVNAIAKTQLAQLDANFAAFGKGLEYYDLRIEKSKQAFKDEMMYLEAMKEAAKKPKEIFRAEQDIIQLQQKHAQELIDLELQRTQAIAERIKKEKEALAAEQAGRAQAQGIVRGATGRATFAAGGLTEQFNQQQAELKTRQEEEQKQLLALKEKGYADELDAFKLHQAHMLEQEKLNAEQRSKLVGTYFSATKSVLGNVSSAFQDFYKATGERHKEFFHIYKAAAVAETIIGTYQAAQDAYKALAGIPYVGPALAAAAAGAAIAAGVGRVAVIRAQKMAEGGLVGESQDVTGGGAIMGYSPHSRADNVPVHATAGEYMHPVSTVRHYGMQAMEAIRQRLIPKEVISQFINPNLRVPAGSYLAGGGMVATGGVGASYSINVPVSTVDTVDGLAGRLQGAIEGTVRRVLEEELR